LNFFVVSYSKVEYSTPSLVNNKCISDKLFMLHSFEIPSFGFSCMYKIQTKSKDPYFRSTHVET